MSKPLSPIVSEFDSDEAAKDYEDWLKAKVAASLADPAPNTPHDEVMAEVKAIVDAKLAAVRAD